MAVSSSRMFPSEEERTSKILSSISFNCLDRSKTGNSIIQSVALAEVTRKQMRKQGTVNSIVTGTDAEFFLVGVAPLRNGVTNWWRKQILKANTKKEAFERLRMHIIRICIFCRLPVVLESHRSSQRGRGYAPPAPSPKIRPWVNSTFYSQRSEESVHSSLPRALVSLVPQQSREVDPRVPRAWS